MTQSHIVFTSEGLIRAAHLRGKSAGLTQSENALFYAFLGDSIALTPHHHPLWTRAELERFGSCHDMVFLGLEDDAARFACRFSAAQKSENGWLWQDKAVDETQMRLIDLRSLVLQSVVPQNHFNPLAQAKSVLFWHQRHGFCANCGAKSHSADGGWRRDCFECKAQHFPRTDPVVIMLAVRKDQCLMGRQKAFAPKVYSSLAGFMEPGETIEQAVRREIFEEAGIVTGRVQIMANQPWPFPSSLMIAAFAEALDETITMDHHELEDCRWFSREDCAAMLSGTHHNGFLCPPNIGISHYLIKSFVANSFKL